MGHWELKCHGGKPLQTRNAPPTWSQQGKSRHPPRSHNHCPGWGGKTDTIDVGEDHSPQDEIALHSIQPNVTTAATAHATGNTKGASAHDELFIDAINYGTVGNTHPEEIMVGDVHAPWTMRHTPLYSCLQVPAEKELSHSALRLTPE